MNKVITINLCGDAYQLEEGGYDALRQYLETAAARLQGNPDRGEILSDIERAIAEKFRALLASRKTVVETKEVETVIAEMGPIEAEAGAGAGGSADEPKTATEESKDRSDGTPRRVYRIREGAMISGVCNGIAAYTNIDPTIIRLAFVLLTMLGGSGVLIYIVMVMVIPEARSPEEKAAASGFPPTAQEFIRRAKEGYYEAMKGFPDQKARREWKRQFKREMRAHADQWRYNWHSYCTEHVTLYPRVGLTLPVLSVLHGVATVLWVCALISLLATGMVFGLALPANMPIWVAALSLFFVYVIFVGPLKAARHLYYWSLGGQKGPRSFVFLWDAVVSMAVIAILLCLGLLHFPELREAVQGIPPLLHQAIDAISAWWKGE